MILGGVNFGTTFLGLYVVEHFGRRKSLMFGAAWMFVCFMVFASGKLETSYILAINSGAELFGKRFGS